MFILNKHTDYYFFPKFLIYFIFQFRNHIFTCCSDLGTSTLRHWISQILLEQRGFFSQVFIWKLISTYTWLIKKICRQEWVELPSTSRVLWKFQVHWNARGDNNLFLKERNDSKLKAPWCTPSKRGPSDVPLQSFISNSQEPHANPMTYQIARGANLHMMRGWFFKLRRVLAHTKRPCSWRSCHIIISSLAIRHACWLKTLNVVSLR